MRTRSSADSGSASSNRPAEGGHQQPQERSAEDLVDRQLTAAAPNVVWLTDITEHNTAEGELYLCAIEKVYSGRLVGYSIDSRMKAASVGRALPRAGRGRHD